MPPTGDCFDGLLGLRCGRLTSLQRWCSGSGDLDVQPPEPCPQEVVRVRGPNNVPTTQGAIGEPQIDDVRNAGRSRQGTHAAGLLGCERLDPAPVEQARARGTCLPTIIDTLLREPTLPLFRMQDIGGCRAILPTIPTIRAVQERLARPSWARELITVSDYIYDPCDSGYRGLELTMLYRRRIVEIQLRTPVMHEWAAPVERLADRYGVIATARITRGRGTPLWARS